MVRSPLDKPKPIAQSTETKIGGVPEGRSAKRRRRASVDGPDAVDLHVGGRLRLRRVLMGMTQSSLAAAIGLTFQQVQKYEHGANRVSASMLYRIARVLVVPVGFFFDDMPEERAETPPANEPENVLVRRESMDLLRNYYRIPGGSRRAVHDLVKALAQGPDNKG